MRDFEAKCQEYVALLCSEPNGWGQHVHPEYGQSHFMLIYMAKKWGKEQVVDRIAKIFKEKLKED